MRSYKSLWGGGVLDSMLRLMLRRIRQTRLQRVLIDHNRRVVTIRIPEIRWPDVPAERVADFFSAAMAIREGWERRGYVVRVLGLPSQVRRRATTAFVLPLLWVSLLLSLLSSGTAAATTPEQTKPVRIGVLANRGAAVAGRMWQPPADYLSSQVPGYSFIIVPLGFDEMNQAVASGKVDFVTTTPSNYIELELLCDATRILTLRTKRQGVITESYGAVIFVRADRPDIASFSDLSGKSFMGADREAFSWQMVCRELKEAGIDPYRKFGSMRFGGSHDDVVLAVRDRKVDVGTARTDLLERMAAEGKIKLTEFRVLNPQPQMPQFPFLRSTRLYPEWPLAVLPQTPKELAREVVVALLKMPGDSPAAKAAECAGWNVPLDYSPVHECLRELHLGPYRNEGRVTPGAIFRQYQSWIWAGATFLVLLLGGTIQVLRLNGRLRRVHSELRSELVERQRVEEANQAKSDFLANMSHEIRTPMTAILGYADMMRAPGQSASDRLDCIHTIRREAEHLLSILNDILDLSKIEAGKLLVERIECHPARIVNEVISLMRVRAIEKNLRLTVTYAGPIPESIQSDPTRLRQILINLIGNAIKFTEKGGVQVLVGLEDTAMGANSRLRIDVIDSGIGMTPDQVAGLFRPFAQADASTTRRFGGTGLGLVICRRLVQMLGGQIAVQSKPASGSRFTVTVGTGSLEGVRLIVEQEEAIGKGAPAAPLSGASETEDAPGLSGRILLAEDGIHNQRVIAFYLQRAGAEVSIADNGRIACEKAMAALTEGQPFDLILMDMQMPELDGYAATATLRAKGYTGPIVALTAHAMSQDRDKCINAGCTDYLAKPIDRTLLIATAGRYLNETRPTAAPCTAPPAALPGPDGESELLKSNLDDDGVRAFLPTFLDDLPPMVGRLKDLIDQQNLEELRRLVHQIKGASGIYGFPAISDEATRVERRLDGVADLKRVEEDLKSLIQLIRRIEGYDAAREALSVCTAPA